MTHEKAEVKIEEDREEILRREYPEILELSKRLRKKQLTKIDKWNLNEISEASGWNKEDIIEDLTNLDSNPSERFARYYELFDKYYHEAKELKDKDNLQAAEKLWGAITALIKSYAARKGVFISHWGREKLDRFVENNIEKEKRSLFYDLLTYGGELHEHFFENHLPYEKFDIRWEQCLKLIEKLKGKD